LDWLATQNVPLIRLRWDGEFTSIVTTGGQAASAKQVRWQDETRRDPKKRVAFSLNLIRQKASNSLTTMKEYVPRSSVWEKACDNVKDYCRQLKIRPPKTVNELLGVEGLIASNYFRTWSAISLKWKATKRHPIPDDWREYRSRSALRPGLLRNYRATHPVNAMLNYAYGVLTTRTQIQLQLIAEGYDPNIGVLHHQAVPRGYFPALVLDHIEPMRPLVDRAVLQLVESETFSGADFSIQHDGVCRLNPELARRVAQLALEHLVTVRRGTN
jgi:CRISPR-associated endonuclease Cas1